MPHTRKIGNCRAFCKLAILPDVLYKAMWWNFPWHYDE